MNALTTTWDFILAGGPVMWPLMALSLWLWSLVLLKCLWLLKAGRERLTADQALRRLRGGEGNGLDQGPRGQVLADFMAERAANPKTDALWLEVAVRRQSPVLWRYVNTILALAAAAPLLGLLGTVTGMIDTFRVIMLFGTGNAQALSAGISQALITTQAGLLIAIPGLFAGWFLRRQVRKLQQKLFSFQQAVDRWLRSPEEVNQCCA